MAQLIAETCGRGRVNHAQVTLPPNQGRALGQELLDAVLHVGRLVVHMHVNYLAARVLAHVGHLATQLTTQVLFVSS